MLDINFIKCNFKVGNNILMKGFSGNIEVERNYYYGSN